jgi:hypothetical protein
MQALAEARMPDDAEQCSRAQPFAGRFLHWADAVWRIAEVEGCSKQDAFFKLGDAIACRDIRAVDGNEDPLSPKGIHDRLTEEFDHIRHRVNNGDALSYAKRWRRPELVTYVSFEDLKRRWPPKHSSLPTAGHETSAVAVSPLQEKPPDLKKTEDEQQPSTPRLRSAPTDKIEVAIRAAYDDAQLADQKPPNLKEIIEPVKRKLSAQGLEASGLRIQELAGAEVYKNRRRKPGATVSSERRKQNS